MPGSLISHRMPPVSRYHAGRIPADDEDRRCLRHLYTHKCRCGYAVTKPLLSALPIWKMEAENLELLGSVCPRDQLAQAVFVADDGKSIGTELRGEVIQSRIPTKPQG